MMSTQKALLQTLAQPLYNGSFVEIKALPSQPLFGQEDVSVPPPISVNASAPVIPCY